MSEAERKELIESIIDDIMVLTHQNESASKQDTK